MPPNLKNLRRCKIPPRFADGEIDAIRKELDYNYINDGGSTDPEERFIRREELTRALDFITKSRTTSRLFKIAYEHFMLGRTYAFLAQKLKISEEQVKASIDYVTDLVKKHLEKTA